MAHAAVDPSPAPGRDERTFHGVTVPNPHPELRDTASPQTQAWADAQDRATDEFLRQCPELPRLRAFLEHNAVAPDPVWHAQRGPRCYTLARQPGLDQPVLQLREGAVERVLFDPNPAGLSIQQDQVSVCPSGRYVALLAVKPGEVLGTLRVLDGATGALVEESDFTTVMPQVAWHPRGHGYYYSLCRRLFGEFDARRDGLYWHVVQGGWATDACVHEYHDGPGHIAYAIVPDEGDAVLLCTRQFSNGRSGVCVCRLPDDPAVDGHAAATVFADLEGYSEFIGAAGGELYFHTCVDAPNGRIVAVDPVRPERRHWRTVVAEGALALGRPERFGGPLKAAVSAHGLLLTVVEHAHDALRRYALDGKLQQLLELPVLATVDGAFADGAGFRVYAQSFLLPRVVYEWRPQGRAAGVIDQELESPALAHGAALVETARLAMPHFDPDAFELRQEFVPAGDGAQIPLYLLHARGMVRGGDTPTLLYGYGGFGQSISPEYFPSIALWLSLGGVYALANIRGGGEYGERWHQAGSGLQKQTCFDDFYAAAEYLIAQRYTAPQHMVARGISNGGLLTAVCAHQRPDLFAAVVSEAPLVDMLGLDDSSTGRAVAAEYGNPGDPAAFAVLRAYSPLHNIRSDVRTPAQMIVVADHDTSASPEQAYPYVAARQDGVAGSPHYAPVLLRIVRGEGHTQWPPAKELSVQAEEIAFLHHFARRGHSAQLRQQRDLRMPLRDGVELSANLWRPAGSGRVPAVLLRTPYESDAAQFERLGLRAYVEAGYAVVIQSVRGCGRSGGRFGFFFAEADDGYDSVEWLATQNWCDGQVAMDGGSYLGTAQWLAARERPPHLACIMPAVPAGDWFNEIPYIGGALQVDWAFSWLGTRAGLAFDFDVTGDRNLEKYRPLRNAGAVLGAELPLYQEILAHPTLDAWWRPLQLQAEDYARLTTPVFTVTGWFDGDQAGTLRYWQELSRHNPELPAQLIVGPWEHAQCYLGGETSVRDMHFGEASILPLRDLRLAFLDRHLRGRPGAAVPRAQVFTTGSNRWHGFPQYPPADVEPQRWFLRSAGHANTAGGDGVLSTAGPAGEPDRYAFDPADPVPYKPGAADHRALEDRADVLVYTGEALREPLTVIGAVEAVIHAASSARDTDFTAKLLDVQPDGRAISLTHVGGVLRARYRKGFDRAVLLEPGRPEEFRIRLSHVGHTFLPGHRVRLEISSSNFPLADPNPNTGGHIADETRIEIAQQTVFHDAAHPSHLLLPVWREPDNDS